LLKRKNVTLSNPLNAHIAEDAPAFERRWLALFFICISLLTVAMDNTILNNALPSIARNLGASGAELQWIVDAYVLVFASLLLTMGAAGDRLGRKRLLQVGLFLFAVGSGIAALSNNIAMLTAVRAFMGVGAAMIFPSTLSIIVATFPRRELPQAIAIWSAMFGLGVGAGPLIGGSLLTVFNWTAVFLVNIPLVAVALIGGAFILAESRDASAPPPDVPGVVLSVVGLFSLVYAIITAGEVGLTAPNVVIAFVSAILILSAFVVWELRSPAPMLPLQFFHNRSFSAANVVLITTAFTLQGFTFLTAQYLQSVHGFSALEAGLRVFPLAVTVVISTLLSAQLAKRIGTKYTVALGASLTSFGLAYSALVFAPTSEYPTILVGFIIVAAGLGLGISPATSSVMVSLPPRKAGVGSALNDTTRQLGGALGIAVLGTIVNTFYLGGLNRTLNITAGLPIPLTHALTTSIQAAHAAITKAELAPDVTARLINATNQAFMDGFARAFLLSAIVMLGTVGLALWTLPRFATRTETPIVAAAEILPEPGR